MLTLTRPEGPEPEDLHLSRRGIAAMFFAGYAAAALSADAAPIHTDEAGLTTETVMLPTAGQSIRGYIARPAAPGRHPVVIVVNEVFGLHEYIRDICRRFAKLGYAAIAPGFFDRAGDPAPLTSFPDILKIVNAASDEQVMGDIGTTLKYVERAPWANARSIGITGFCWGGRWVWNASETFPQIKAGAAWYGQLAPAPNAKPDPSRWWPIEHVATLHGPVIGLYGGKDALSAAVPAMREALTKAGKSQSKIFVYEDAGHGFHADYRPSYDEADAKDGWTNLLDFFKANGVAPRAS
ncbi:MAG: dienelactone hydrolase family protein [Caulobacterales bacterium]